MAITTAKGTTLGIGDGASPEVFSSMGQLRAFSQSGPTATVQDITTHSTSANWMDKLGTLLDGGSVSGPINYNSTDATHAFSTGIWDDLVNLTVRNIRITFPNSNGTLDMGGYFSSHAFDFPVDNVLQANMEFAVTGAITAANS
jgi:hypothetical protein